MITEEELDNALTYLIEQGLVEAVVDDEGETVYRLTEKGREENAH